MSIFYNLLSYVIAQHNSLISVKKDNYVSPAEETATWRLRFGWFFSVFNLYLFLFEGRALQILVWPVLWKNPFVSQCHSAHCQGTHWCHDSCNHAIKQLPFQTAVPPCLPPSSQAQLLSLTLLHLPMSTGKDILLSSECFWSVSKPLTTTKALLNGFLMALCICINLLI